MNDLTLPSQCSPTTSALGNGAINRRLDGAVSSLRAELATLVRRASHDVRGELGAAEDRDLVVGGLADTVERNEVSHRSRIKKERRLDTRKNKNSPWILKGILDLQDKPALPLVEIPHVPRERRVAAALVDGRRPAHGVVGPGAGAGRGRVGEGVRVVDCEFESHVGGLDAVDGEVGQFEGVAGEHLRVGCDARREGGGGGEEEGEGGGEEGGEVHGCCCDWWCCRSVDVERSDLEGWLRWRGGLV